MIQICSQAQSSSTCRSAARQLGFAPKTICALGATAAKYLTHSKEGVTRTRGNWYKWHDIPVYSTTESHFPAGVSPTASLSLYPLLRILPSSLYSNAKE
jgi:hypothetical protein